MPRFINPVPEFEPNGNLYFFKSNSTDPLTTYADSLMTIPNPHPVKIDGAGRCPNIFYEGSAKVRHTDSLDALVWERDPVGGENLTGQLELWDTLITYSKGEIVRTSSNKYYQSLSDNNQGNDPDAPSPAFWSEVRFLGAYNASESYSLGAVVAETDGSLWRSKVNSNLGNQPSTDGGANWEPAVTGLKIPEVSTLETRTTTVIEHTGGGTLTALRVNELHDGSTYTLPAASSVSAGQTITITLPDRYSSFTPTVQANGADTITDSAGTDTSVIFDAGSALVILTSDGVSNWSL